MGDQLCPVAALRTIYLAAIAAALLWQDGTVTCRIANPKLRKESGSTPDATSNFSTSISRPDPSRSDCEGVAQLVERWSPKPDVVGSNPAAFANHRKNSDVRAKRSPSGFSEPRRPLLKSRAGGRVVECTTLERWRAPSASPWFKSWSARQQIK